MNISKKEKSMVKDFGRIPPSKEPEPIKVKGKKVKVKKAENINTNPLLSLFEPRKTEVAPDTPILSKKDSFF